MHSYEHTKTHTRTHTRALHTRALQHVWGLSCLMYILSPCCSLHGSQCLLMESHGLGPNLTTQPQTLSLAPSSWCAVTLRVQGQGQTSHLFFKQVKSIFLAQEKTFVFLEPHYSPAESSLYSGTTVPSHVLRVCNMYRNSIFNISAEQ